MINPSDSTQSISVEHLLEVPNGRVVIESIHVCAKEEIGANL